MSKFKPSSLLPGELVTPAVPAVPLAPAVAGPAAAAGSPSAERKASSPMQNLGAWLVLLFLFVAYSRIPEFVAPGFHIPLVLSLAALLVALFSGRLFHALAAPVGFSLSLFTGWLLLSVPLSVWKRQSVETLTGEWFKSLALFLLVTSLMGTLKNVERAINVIAYGILVLAVLAMLTGVTVSGRLQLAQGQYGNPNDLAGAMSTGLLFWWYIVHDPKRNFAVRGAGLVALTFLGVVLGKTGSRATLVALVAVVVYLFFHYSMAGRIRFLAVIAALMAVATAFVPDMLLNRFTTIFATDEPAETNEELQRQEEALGSTRSRLYLLRQGIAITLQDPILGAGVGTFAVAENEYAESEGRRGAWHGTHNTYLQVSSEAGIPALAFFLAAIAFSWRSLRRAAQAAMAAPEKRRRELLVLGTALKLNLVGFITSGMFGHFAYSMFFPTTAGLIYALESSIRQEFEPADPAPKAMPPAPARVGLRRRFKMGRVV